MLEEPHGPDGTLDPDASEEELAIELDNIVPTHGYSLTRVVGLGGSAGSISALQQFFSAMPADSGMAFVVILHLSPEHDSSLSEVLQKTTTMQVQKATDGQRVQINHVYVIPPGKHLSLSDGHLRVTDLPKERGKRLTVDLFFRSLADTHGPHSVGIVLSGVDGDGALGVKRIKERGGLTIAQDPEEAEYSGMPRSAIATQMVDWILETSEMPARLLEYQAREPRLQLPSETGPNPATLPLPTPSSDEASLREVLAFLRTRTGRDFSYYKRATIVRRIARRMQVNEVDTVAEYLACLRTHPGEAGALLQDLLISVTNFFRDREAFVGLEQQVPGLFRGLSATDTVRVWVPACATGEEAYSIAILLSEHARTLEAPPAIQVFATDLDEAVLGEARSGIYPPSIETDVSPQRLQRYFVKEHRGYRVRRELRECLLFAVHDLLKDSPFSRLDLISCRNLLIYLNRDAQRRALDTFHFALRPDGRLFLGTSEAADDAHDLFSPISKKHRLYASRAVTRTSMPIPAGPNSLMRALAAREAAEPAVSLARQAPPRAEGTPSRSAPLERMSWSDLHLRLIERVGPPSLLVNGDQEIVHLSESASEFLQFRGGQPSMNLLQLVHPLLRADLRAALFRARESGQLSSAFAVPFEHGGRRRLVDLQVLPAPDLAGALALIVFELRPSEEQLEHDPEQHEPVIQHLERELEQTKRQLREEIDQHEVSNEELKASNEELQAMNEELRSATEELETSREELQSINEELTTVNFELKAKVDELFQSNGHLQSLMGATAIATIFLDQELCIVRFTPPAMHLFSLIETDIGRPLSHMNHLLQYPELLDDANRILEQLAPLEREVQDNEGRFFLARLLPYRMPNDRIGGVVLTFVDISDLHQAQEALRQSQHTLEHRVGERTAQLDFTNDQLRAEVIKHQDAEKARHELQRRLIGAQEQERRRISRELHDEVGQLITALMLALKAAESELPANIWPEKFREVRTIAEQVGREIHQLATQLRPVALDELGLSGALTGHLDSWAARSGIPVDFFGVGIDDARLPGVVETTIYRIVQEAMNNVLKHASATSVSVSVQRRADHVLTIVEDDGNGFDPAQPPSDASRIGIAGMRERASVVGGALTIESKPGGGTTVRAQLPIPPT